MSRRILICLLRNSELRNLEKKFDKFKRRGMHAKNAKATSNWKLGTCFMPEENNEKLVSRRPVAVPSCYILNSS